MESGEIDLSAFPLLRIDQLDRVQDSTLNTSLSEVSKILLGSGANEDAFEAYLQRQQQAVTSEILRRRAASRVTALVSGSDLPHTAETPPLEPCLRLAGGAVTSTAAPKPLDGPPVAPLCVAACTLGAPAAHGEARGVAADEGESWGNWQDAEAHKGRLNGLFLVRPPRPKRRPSLPKARKSDHELQKELAELQSQERERRRAAALERLHRRKQEREAQKQRQRVARAGRRGKGGTHGREPQHDAAIAAGEGGLQGQGQGQARARCTLSSDSESVSGGEEEEEEEDEEEEEAATPSQLPKGLGSPQADETVLPLNPEEGTAQAPALEGDLWPSRGQERTEACTSSCSAWGSLEGLQEGGQARVQESGSDEEQEGEGEGQGGEEEEELQQLQPHPQEQELDESKKVGAASTTLTITPLSPLAVGEASVLAEDASSCVGTLPVLPPPPSGGLNLSARPVSDSVLGQEASCPSVCQAPVGPDYTKVLPSFAYIFSLFNIRPLALGRARRVDLAPIGDAQASVHKALRRQLQLYSHWQQVMRDYSAVFARGNGPQGVQMAAAITGRSTSHSVYGGGPAVLHYRVVASSKPEVYNIVSDVLGQLPVWEELPGDLGLRTTWNLLWTWSKPRINYDGLLIFQRVNHFPRSKELTRKDLLKRHVSRLLALERIATCNADKGEQDSFRIMPQSFILPQEYTDWVAAHQEAVRLSRDRRCTWIMKPVGLSRGRGIQLVDDVSTISYSETVVLQRYVAEPYLLDGYKFDLRLYVLVTSFQPLEAFIYTEGFARISTEHYDATNIKNRLIHLTNSSIQKFSSRGPTADNPISTAPRAEAGGTKMSLSYLWTRLRDKGVDVDAVWSSILTLVLKSLVCVEDSIPFQPNSFELFGYDILLDRELRPWLLEVNSSPSMARENQLDRQVKEQLIRETIELVDPVPFDREALLEVLRRRLGCKEAAGPTASQLQDDLSALLQGRRPRLYGEMPQNMGNFERLCPHTSHHRTVMRLKRRCKVAPQIISGHREGNR